MTRPEQNPQAVVRGHPDRMERHSAQAHPGDARKGGYKGWGTPEDDIHEAKSGARREPSESPEKE